MLIIRSLDVLDQFSPPAQPAASATTSTSAPPQPQPQPATDADEAEFRDRLSEEMASLIRGLEPESGAKRDPLAAAWEAMLVEGMDGMSGPSAPASTSSSNARTSADAPREGNFQSRIRSAANRLRESESGLQSSDPPASGEDNLQSLLSQLEGLGDIAGEGGEEKEIQGVLEAMMGQLMSKDVLYEPLKELHDKASALARLTRVLA